MFQRTIESIRRLTAEVANPKPERRGDHWVARPSWPEGTVVVTWRLKDANDYGEGRVHLQDSLVVGPLGQQPPNSPGGLDPATFNDDNSETILLGDLTHAQVARLARSYFYDNAEALLVTLLDAGTVSPMTLLAVATMRDDVSAAAWPVE